jgi:hypothetical protein
VPGAVRFLDRQDRRRLLGYPTLIGFPLWKRDGPADAGVTDWPRPSLRWAALLLASAVLAAALAAILLPALSIGLVFERSWNEGWNAYHQARAAAGDSLYGTDPWRPVNYPFLSFYLVGRLGPLFGNVLIAGRVLNLIALAAVMGCGALFVRRCGGGVPEMLFAAGCVLGFQQIQAGDWLAVDEPQMLAEAFALGGLLCYVSGPPGLARLFGCALLFAAGGFVKPIAVAFPAAVTIDLVWRSPRLWLRWLLCLLLAACLFAAASAVVAGGDFLARTVEPRPWLWCRVLYHGKKLFFFLKGPLAASIVVWCGRLPPGRSVLVRAAGIAALGGGLVFAGGDGVSVNVFLELAVIMGLTAGLALAAWRRLFSVDHWPGQAAGHETAPAIVGRNSEAPSATADRRNARSALFRPTLFRLHLEEKQRATAAVALALLLPLVFASPILARTGRSLPPLWHLAASWRALDARQAGFLAAAAWLRGQPGPALCESLLLCFAAGKPLVVDPYGARERILTGGVDEAPLLQAITAHRFAVIALPEELRADPHDPRHILSDVLTVQRFTPASLTAIARCYAPTARSAVAFFYTPRHCE